MLRYAVVLALLGSALLAVVASERSPDAPAWWALLGGSSAAPAGPELKSIRCALKRLPDSPLQRRNLLAALRRLDGTVLGPGESADLASMLGPWVGGDYCLAPCREGSRFVACFGAGAEPVSALVTGACRAAGLKVARGERSGPSVPAPVQPGLRISNPTALAARFSVQFLADKPALTISARRALSASRSRPAESPPAETWQLAAVGDVVCDPHRAGVLHRVPPGLAGSPVAQTLGRAELRLANLECPLTDADAPTPLKSRAELARNTEFLFRGRPGVAAGFLRALNLNVVSLANNHIFDYGDRGIADTCKSLDAAGIGCAGPGLQGSDPRAGRRQVPGGTCTVLSFVTDETLPAGALQTLSGAAVLDTRPAKLRAAVAHVADLVRAARRRSELPVVCFHWGMEGTAEPTAQQRELARAAARAGAVLVIGHHPHRLQPLDAIGGCPVAYSLGNFVLAPVHEPQELSGVLVVEMLGDRAFAAGLIPLRIAPDGLPDLLCDADPDAATILRDLGIGTS